MLSELATQLNTFMETSKHYLPTMLYFIGGLWVFNLINWSIGSPFNILGIRPRHLFGLVGILFSPILHANFAHLLFNTFPLLCLGIFVMTLGLMQFYWATGIIMLVSGFTVWLIGRRGNHIGASGLISGYFGFVIFSAYLQPTLTTFFCAGVALYYFGGILFSLLPTDAETSWEGHLSGFLAGLLANYLCTNEELLLHWIQLYLKPIQ